MNGSGPAARRVRGVSAPAQRPTRRNLPTRRILPTGRERRARRARAALRGRAAPREQPERGSATVLGIGAILLILSVLVGFLVLGAAVHGSLRARAAADAAALAGAAVLLEGGPEVRACATAGELAAANGGTLLSCEQQGGDTATTAARLRVKVEVAIPGLRQLEAQAVAHAGAVPQRGPG